MQEHVLRCMTHYRANSAFSKPDVRKRASARPTSAALEADKVVQRGALVPAELHNSVRLFRSPGGKPPPASGQTPAHAPPRAIDSTGIQPSKAFGLLKPWISAFRGQAKPVVPSSSWRHRGHKRSCRDSFLVQRLLHETMGHHMGQIRERQTAGRGSLSASLVSGPVAIITGPSGISVTSLLTTSTSRAPADFRDMPENLIDTSARPAGTRAKCRQQVHQAHFFLQQLSLRAALAESSSRPAPQTADCNSRDIFSGFISISVTAIPFRAS